MEKLKLAAEIDPNLFEVSLENQRQLGVAGPKSPQKEADPHGKAQNEPGAKLDHGKARLGLVLGGFSPALEEVGKIGTFGANKYSPNGWLSVPNGVERYTDAMLRHWLKECKGEALDPETELLHAAHLAWNALARLTLILRERA